MWGADAGDQRPGPGRASASWPVARTGSRRIRAAAHARRPVGALAQRRHPLRRRRPRPRGRAGDGHGAPGRPRPVPVAAGDRPVDRGAALRGEPGARQRREHVPARAGRRRRVDGHRGRAADRRPAGDPAGGRAVPGGGGRSGRRAGRPAGAGGPAGRAHRRTRDDDRRGARAGAAGRRPGSGRAVLRRAGADLVGNPPAPDEQPLLERFRRIGVGPGVVTTEVVTDPSIRAALTEGVLEARVAVAAASAADCQRVADHARGDRRVRRRHGGGPAVPFQGRELLLGRASRPRGGLPAGDGRWGG